MQRMGAISLTMACMMCAGGPAFAAGPATFADDVAFLRDHVEVLVLSGDGGKAQVAVCPAYQGRVMTSTARGTEGSSFGWVNRDLIASGEILPHINVYGGEDRFWMGPEGGQFAIFFPKDAPFDLEHWQTPAVIDTEPFELAAQSPDSLRFARRALLPNASGTWFDVQVDRTIRLLGRGQTESLLGVACPESVDLVAYASENVLTNKGADPWKKETGLLSIWILGMYNPSPDTTVVVPFEQGPESECGPVVNDAYFGKVPAERLIVGDGVLFFRGDAQYRSKIGLAPKRAKPILGSYAAEAGVLSLVQYSKPEGAEDYVNSMWEHQEEPYCGDVVNSYNDSFLAPGNEGLGAFYELETSSPAAALAPNASITHMHRTYHFQGDEVGLDAIAKATLGVGLKDIKGAFAR